MYRRWDKLLDCVTVSSYADLVTGTRGRAIWRPSLSDGDLLFGKRGHFTYPFLFLRSKREFVASPLPRSVEQGFPLLNSKASYS